MTLERLPGVEPVNMIYDNKDRLVLSQDGEQSGKGEWLYSKYDNFNRVKKLTETYYDNYSFAGKSNPITAGSTSCATGFFTSVKGLVTGAKVRVLGVSGVKWITTTNY